MASLTKEDFEKSYYAELAERSAKERAFSRALSLPGTEWDTGDADPIADIEAAKKKILEPTGFQLYVFHHAIARILRKANHGEVAKRMGR